MSDNTQLRKDQREWVQRLEIHRDGVIDFVAVWGPLLAPMVPAGLTAAAIIVVFPDLLHIEQWAAWLIAIITVASLEVLGIVSVETWLDMRRYNAEHKDAEESAPVGQALSVVVIYAIVVLSLVFILKIWKEAALYSLIPLTMLGLITSWTIVLRKQHNARTWATETQQAEQSEIDQLRAMLTEQQGRIAQMTADHEQRMAGLTTAHAAQLEQMTTARRQEIDRLTSEHDTVTTALNNRIDQLVDQLDNLRSVQSVPVVQIPPVQFVQQAPKVVYQNGDIVHGLEHLELTDRVKVVAQRMRESGQSVNKSRIAELLECSRTTVQKVLS